MLLTIIEDFLDIGLFVLGVVGFVVEVKGWTKV